MFAIQTKTNEINKIINVKALEDTIALEFDDVGDDVEVQLKRESRRQLAAANVLDVDVPTTTSVANTAGQLHVIDENYVCDISLMKIDDMKHFVLEDESYLRADDALIEVNLAKQSCLELHGDSPVGNNEVEIDCIAEEETITELVRASNNGQHVEATNGRMRVVFGILLRLVLPLANGVARGIKGIREVRILRALQNLASSRQALTNLVAFAANTISMNLSSVQVSNRIGPLLQLLKLRNSRDGIESFSETLSISGASTPTSTPSTPIANSPMIAPFLRQPRNSLPIFSASNKRKTLEHVENAPNCCTLNILAEPPPGTPIHADIVFIHGLHGSLVNTWKQGLWENERQPVEFERPPKPPVRPPKRPRHSRSTTAHQQPCEKRAKFAYAKRNSLPGRMEDLYDYNAKKYEDTDAHYSYVCGTPQNIQICEDIEYSFPTFRLRSCENSRLLQAQLASMLNDESSIVTNASTKAKEPNANNTDNTKAKTKHKQSIKPSPNDPNYSKCWPGDWLPLDCPGVRVIAVNYTTDQYLWRPLWKNKEPRSGLVQRAREMAELLVKHRVGHGHPIVYVGHSKGGLYIKQLIVDAWECGKPAMTPLWRSARGVFFYSVPHRGSHLACIKAPLLTRSVELLDIEKNNKYLLDLHRRFAGLYHLGHLKIEVFSFVETALTLMSVLYVRIVGVDSADPGIGDVCGIRLDHREICKPRGRDCILYKELVKMIKKVC